MTTAGTPPVLDDETRALFYELEAAGMPLDQRADHFQTFVNAVDMSLTVLPECFRCHPTLLALRTTYIDAAATLILSEDQNERLDGFALAAGDVDFRDLDADED